MYNQKMKEVITMLNFKTPCDDKENGCNCPYNATTHQACEYWCGRTDFPNWGNIEDQDTLSQEIPEGSADFADYIMAHPYFYAED
jgi:hypothetical protein